MSRRRSPLKFFVLVFALSVPFWIAGAVTSARLLPGLPVSALALVCPMLYELNELIRLVSLERIVVLTDHETDAPALEETAQRAWARLPAGSPNLAHANPVLTVLRCSNRSADERMVVSSLSAASRG